MTRLFAVTLVLLLSGCATGGSGWVTLIDGARGMENFNNVGTANWQVKDGSIYADRSVKDAGYLVTRKAYRDFNLRVEFWASHDANSGIFARCADPKKIGDETCYEANIFDQRPDPTYATGAIVKFAPVAQPFARAGGKWNTFELTARGDHLVVVFNGVKTVDIRDSKFASGPIALQWGRGTIKWRKVEIRPL